jgi:hypothetical protein
MRHRQFASILFAALAFAASGAARAAENNPVAGQEQSPTPAADAAPVEESAADVTPDQPAPVQAIWKEQEITFYFQSFTTFYSCYALEDRIERLLKELGARAKVRVRAPECPTAIARMPRVIIDVTSPVEATAAAIAERDKGKSTRELAARVQGKSAEDAAFAAPFPAQWKRLSLSRGKLNIEPGECDLIDELRRKVLPKLAVRIVENNVQCSPHQVSLGQPQLEIETLVEIPKPDDRTDDEPDESGPPGELNPKQ